MTSLQNSPFPRFRVIAAWTTTVLWAALIFHLSTATYAGSLTAWVLGEILRTLHIQVSAGTFEILHSAIRKLAHLTEYGIFSMLIYLSLKAPRPRGWELRMAGWALLAAGLYSLSDEFHQSFVPGRTASLVDCGIDTVGAGLGLLLLYGIEVLTQTRRSRTAARNESADEKKKGVAGE